MVKCPLDNRGGRDSGLTLGKVLDLFQGKVGFGATGYLGAPLIDTVILRRHYPLRQSQEELVLGPL